MIKKVIICFLLLMLIGCEKEQVEKKSTTGTSQVMSFSEKMTELNMYCNSVSLVKDNNIWTCTVQTKPEIGNKVIVAEGYMPEDSVTLCVVKIRTHRKQITVQGIEKEE